MVGRAFEGVTFDLVAAHEVAAAFELETQGFPPDEAATLEKLQYRQSTAPDLILGAFTWQPPARRRLVAYACATAVDGEHITHDSMSVHDPRGTTVCIHAVVVHPSMQRRGLAVALLRTYIARLKEQPSAPWARANLLAHAPSVPLYQRAGFELIGPSDVAHGPEPWYEMTADLRGQRNPAVLYAAFATRPERLYAPPMPSETADTALVNAVDLYCPRRQCRSLILRAGHAHWHERPLSALADPRAAPTPSAPDFPPEDTPAEARLPCWSVIPPSPMTFENISVSKSVPDDPDLKYLGCADCDCGPLGMMGREEVLLDARRLRYNVDL